MNFFSFKSQALTVVTNSVGFVRLTLLLLLLISIKYYSCNKHNTFFFYYCPISFCQIHNILDCFIRFSGHLAQSFCSQVSNVLSDVLLDMDPLSSQSSCYCSLRISLKVNNILSSCKQYIQDSPRDYQLCLTLQTSPSCLNSSHLFYYFSSHNTQYLRLVNTLYFSN